MLPENAPIDVINHQNRSTPPLEHLEIHQLEEPHPELRYQQRNTIQHRNNNQQLR